MKKLVCLESEWDGWDKPTSVLPMLQMLAYRENGRLDYVHKHCNSKQSMLEHATEIGRRNSMKVVYIAMHGTPGRIYPDKQGLELTDLADAVGQGWAGRVVHFGSCAVLRSHNAVIEFQRATGAALVTGFRRNVDWDLSTAFDYLCLVQLLDEELNGHLVNRLHRLAQGPFENLGFSSCWNGHYRSAF